jgi:integrase/recombinase XerD
MFKSNDRLIEYFLGYIKHLHARNLSNSTINIYKEKLGIFLQWCEKRHISEFAELTPDNLRAFLIDVRSTHNPGGTHAIYRAVKTFLRWYTFETDEPTPIAKVKMQEPKPGRLDPIPVEDIKALLLVASGRDKAIIYFLYDTGVRVSELVALDRDQYDVVSGETVLHTTKNGEARLVILGQVGRRSMRSYLKTRDDNSPALFVSLFKERIADHGVQEILRRLCHRAGIRVWYPHAFRRSYALSCLRGGMDIFTLQLLMGHQDLQVLRRYLKQTQNDIRITSQRYSPADKL